jgi:hypothetical protein
MVFVLKVFSNKKVRGTHQLKLLDVLLLMDLIQPLHALQQVKRKTLLVSKIQAEGKRKRG